MLGSIVLAGGDEFRPGCEETDSAIIASRGPGPVRVIIVPTAAVTGPSKAASDGVSHFSKLGAVASELMVLDSRHANDPEMADQVSGVSVVYFTGGDPGHLLDNIRGTKLLERLLEELEKGAVVGGSSAGAMVMGSMMRRPPTWDWGPALGVAAGLAVLPHHEHSDPPTVVQDLSVTVPPDLTVLGIDAQTCCLGSPGKWKVLGPGRVVCYRGGSWQAYRSGDTLPPEI